MPWVILGRIPRVAGAQPAGVAAVEAVVQAAVEAVVQAAGDAAVEAIAQAEGVEEVEAVAQAAEGVEEVEADAQAGLDEEVELAADFSFPLVPTPRVTVMNAAPTAQPDPNNPDKYPYILGVHSAALLLNFGVKPFHGVYFGELPYRSSLVVVRHFAIVAGVDQGHPPTATARAERIVPRDGELAVVSNIESIGFLSTPNDVHAYIIVELMVHQDSGIAKLVYIDADDDKWHQEDAENPLPNHNRQWVPSGVISHMGMLWWFDLSWGLISYDHFALVENPLLRFHPLPEGRALDMSQPDIHNRRCITESQDELLFVEIIHDPDGNTEAAMVCMWTRTSGHDNNDVTIGWDVEHAVSFEEIWNDDTYVQAGLPRKVPVLVAVSPFRCDIVYFVLEEEERLFGVDLLTCAVFEYLDEEYDLVTPWPLPPSCRYVLPWSLPPQVAQALGNANPKDLQQLVVEILDAGEIDHEELQEAEIQEELEMAMEIDAEMQEELVDVEQELIAEAQAILAPGAAANDEELQEAEIDDEELQGAEIDDEEQPQAEIHDDDLSSEEMLKASFVSFCSIPAQERFKARIEWIPFLHSILSHFKYRTGTIPLLQNVLFV